MKKIKRIKELIPRWEMPADPVKAVLWFMHWLLRIVVHFFWVPIILMVSYLTAFNWSSYGILSGLSSGIITLLVGLLVWAALYAVLFFVNVSAGVSNVLSHVQDFQQQYNRYTQGGATNSSTRRTDAESKVVESTIINIEDERNKRSK